MICHQYMKKHLATVFCMGVLSLNLSGCGHRNPLVTLPDATVYQVVMRAYNEGIVKAPEAAGLADMAFRLGNYYPACVRSPKQLDSNRQRGKTLCHALFTYMAVAANEHPIKGVGSLRSQDFDDVRVVTKVETVEKNSMPQRQREADDTHHAPQHSATRINEGGHQ